MKPTKVIDLHCDTMFAIHAKNLDLAGEGLHITLDKRPERLHLCQAMAIFMPDDYRGRDAEAFYGSVLRTYREQLDRHKGEITGLNSLNGLGAALEEIPFSCFLTVEGGSAAAGKLENIRRLYDDGVRMMTLTWNAANEIAGGSQTDLGFTPFGRKAVGEMERLGMAVDVSHLSDRGFRELCGFATRPFAASHSNARAVCGHPRNITDDMFREIRDRGGVVGMNYYKNFIAEDGDAASVDGLLRHIHHFLDLGGEDTIALGSDFDGAEIPADLDSLEKVEGLFDAMERSGISATVMEKLQYRNALRFLAHFAG